MRSTLPPRSAPVRSAACRIAATIVVAACFSADSRAELTLRIADYVNAPKTGATGSASDPITFGNSVYLARINFMAEEPGGGRGRFFVNDLNGPLYILDQDTKAFTTYLNFNGRDGLPGMYPEFVHGTGFANGLITFQFDPDYANNGKFYTVHMEQPSTINGVDSPPVNTVSYATTPNIAPGSGGNTRQTILVEWTDTNISNATFEGSARELFRMSMSGQIHPMGDVLFNPNAGPEDPDWRMMYISIGDGGAGEGGGSARDTPQRLDSLGGKILRIRPDNVGANTTLSTSPNGAYYIPTDNPFTGVANSAVRDEVYALGLRNPHRISWDPDTDTMFANDIGLHTWEEVNIVKSGRNFGYSRIEGSEVLVSQDTTSDPLPALLPRLITSSTSSGTMVPYYPVAQYGHGIVGQELPAGDSISSGYVYRGSNIPSLYGKYVFGEITTGQLFWCDLDELIAADDGIVSTMATIHSLNVLWDNPNDAPGTGEELYTTTVIPDPNGDPNEPQIQVFGPMFEIIERAYEARGGTDPNLPGGAAVTGSQGRADIRLQVDEAGELYILSKSDGVIRYIVEAVGDADFNGDDAVDGADFLVWQQNLGTAGGLAQGDADGDGRVTGADLGFWQQQFSAVAPTETAAIPEPASATLAALALLGLARRRRFGCGAQTVPPRRQSAHPLRRDSKNVDRLILLA
jgi:hypothetical protein